ncbi:MAG: hypothetical protein QME21_12825 [Anaerolineales bacterium]|jgi:hypothetical protein|nr:hypothetical protein [Anaerolineales bacterium]
MSSTTDTIQPSSASFRDPSGFLFNQDGALYRQVNRVYQANYEHLMTSGLYEKLTERGLLIPHRETSQSAPLPQVAYRVIQPDRVPFISYPYEWSFSQLKDAALTTLEIQKIALEFGMWLKDSSAYNIQFLHGRPALIDTLSFEIYPEGQPWVAYRQFCQHFLAPLSLMAYCDVRLSQLLRVYIDGVPLDLTSKLLPAITRFKLPLLIHVHLHAASQRRYAEKTLPTRGQMSKTALLGLIDNLESGIHALRWTPRGSEWGDYYEKHNYSIAGLEQKERFVASSIEQICPANVWDLGANIGRFSRLASQRSIFTLAFDSDPAAVDLNYQQCRIEKEKHLLPLLADLTNPSPPIGWQNQERMSLLERGPADVILALALIHHLAISNNVPLSRIAEFLHQAGKWLIIEFVPKSDSQVQKLLAARQDIFPEYDLDGFQRSFSSYFTVLRSEQIQDSQRVLFLMKGK